MAIARSQSAKLFELRAATSLAPLWWEQGKKSAARDLLKPAYGWFTEGLDTPILRSQGKQTVRGRLASLATCIRLDPPNPHLRVGLSHTDSGGAICVANTPLRYRSPGVQSVSRLSGIVSLARGFSWAPWRDGKSQLRRGATMARNSEFGSAAAHLGYTRKIRAFAHQGAEGWLERMTGPAGRQSTQGHLISGALAKVAFGANPSVRSRSRGGSSGLTAVVFKGLLRRRFAARSGRLTLRQCAVSG
jgi:hypothetical protein